MNIRKDFGLYFCILGLLLTAWWIFKDIPKAICYTLFIVGELKIIYSAVGIYIDMKNYRFHIGSIPKKEWRSFLLTQLITWSLFYLLFPEPLFMTAYIIPMVLLPLLLIYDIISSFLRKLFR